MKRIAYVFLAAIVLTGMLVTVSAAQSEPLGDYARSVRKEDKPAAPAKKYDNDNLPTSDNISVVGNATDSAGPEDANPARATTPGMQDAPKKTDAADAQKVNDEWKKKIDDQQGKVDLSSRELDVTQREYRLRAAAFYADAGNRLRNQGSWDREDAQYKQDVAKKQ